MRVMKFNDDLKAALHAMEFEIAPDNKSASITGEIKVEFCDPYPGRDPFQLLLTLPDGTRLWGKLDRDCLMEKAESDAEIEAFVDKAIADYMARR